MSTENITLYPSKTRVIPNIKLAKIVCNLSQEKFEGMVVKGENRSIVEKRNHKKFGKIVSTYTITNADGYDGTDPLNEFDYAVLSVCISEWKEGNRYTTFAVILRALTGKTSERGKGKIQKKQREWIVNSVRKLMSTLITVDLTNVNEKLGYSGEKKLTAPILPAKYLTTSLNGQPVEDVIHFTDESPILAIAEARNQVIRYDTNLLNVPNQNNTPRVIILKNYVLRRVHEIKLHKMTPTLTFDDIFTKCDIADDAREAKVDARNTVKAVFENLKTSGVIKSFSVVKKGVAVHAITFTFK